MEAISWLDPKDMEATIKGTPPPPEEMPIIMERREHIPPSCCICLDVRTGAVVIGLINLVMHASAFIMSTSTALYHRGEMKVQQGDEVKTEQQYYYYYNVQQQQTAEYMLQMLIACLSFVITVMLVYGAALRRPSYVLPFFCMQVFDLSIWTLVSAATVSRSSRIKMALESKPYIGEHIHKMSQTHFLFTLVFVMTAILMIKAYMITVVWSCFKHCKQVNQARQLHRGITAPNGPVLVLPTNMEAMANLPSYDDTMKNPPPPAYSN